ncbi:MAG: hypothetical protein R2863_01285 [Candidatus Kapaibacterium sp.]|nr:hypothetical protein [Ignavibacteriota bacterium]
MKFILFIFLLSIISCSYLDKSPLDETAERLVELTLKAGTIDENLVDSYIGTIEIDTTEEYNIDDLKKSFELLTKDILEIDADTESKMYRKNYQIGIANAVITRLRVLNAEKISFIDECENIYQYTPEVKEYEYFDSLLIEVDNYLAGDESLPIKLSNYRQKFKIKYSKIDEAFRKSVEEARKVTSNYITLPDSESVVIEYLDGAPWSAYNWYQGKYKSLIQVNMQSNIYLERVLDLAAHESYPGHHVYYSLRDKMYYQDSGFVEFSIYTLFSPVSFLAEGTAVYGNDLVFPGDRKIDFLRSEITGKYKYTYQELKEYFDLQELFSKLDEVQITIARDYIDKKISDETALKYIQKYGLESENSSYRRLDFIRRYRSYIINYTAGKQLVDSYIRKKAGNDNEKKWQVYKDILEKPYLPPDLVRALD